MIAADRPLQRPRDGKLLVIDRNGRLAHAPRTRFLDYLRAGDVVVANDAATLPASLPGIHESSGAPIEVRLAGQSSLRPEDVRMFSAVVFGAGDFRTRTEDRPLPPALLPGDHLRFDSAVPRGECVLTARVEAVLEHPRLVSLQFDGSPRTIWAALSRLGRPIQYAHLRIPLALWDVWTPIAAMPAAFEPPSASFILDWRSIHAMRERNIGFATITLAAGISSTGDPTLDRRLPLAEPYRIPEATVVAIHRAHADSGRIVAIGTTVVRALEHAGRDGTSGQARGPPINESARRPHCGSSRPSSRARTSQTPAITRCCVRSRATMCWRPQVHRSRRKATERTSSAIRC